MSREKINIERQYNSDGGRTDRLKMDVSTEGLAIVGAVLLAGFQWWMQRKRLDARTERLGKEAQELAAWIDTFPEKSIED